MQSDSNTALKKLYEAVLVLASEEGKIERRLGIAYSNHLRAIPLSSLPVALVDEWQSILRELETIYPSATTAESLDPSRAVDLAQRILLVYDSMIR